MGSVATLVIQIIADAAKAQKGMDQAAGAAASTSSRIKATMGKAGAAIGAAFSVGAVVDFAKGSVTAASDLNETMSKTQQLFGDSGDAIVQWSKDSANSMGQSQTAAMDAADTFAVMGKSAGLTGGDLVGFSTKFTGLASDMASFSNTSPEQAVEAIGAAMRGESEPIRAYGVMINDAAIKAEALSLGLVKSTGDVIAIKRAQLAAQSAQKAYTAALKDHGAKSEEARTALEKLKLAQLQLGKQVKGTVPQLTQQQKLMATSSLITKQTADAQGDFARTSGGLANQQRILAAKMENVKATVGQFLLPLILKAVTAFQGLAHWVANNTKLMIPLAAGIAAVYTAIKVGQASAAIGEAGGLVAYLKQLKLVAGATKIWSGVQAVLNFVMNQNPIVRIVTILVLLGTVLVIAYKKSATFRAIVQGALHGVMAVAQAMWSVLKTVFTAIWNILKFVGTLWFTLYVKPFIIAYQILKAAITLAVGWITTAFNTVIGFFKDLPGNIAAWLSTLWGIITAPFRAAWQWIWDNVITPLVAFFKNIPGQIQTELSTLWAIIKWPFEHAWNWIWDNVIGPLVRFFKNIPGQIQQELSTLWNIIKWPFEQAWNWIWNNVIGPLVNFFKNLPGQVQQELSTLWNIIKWPFEQAWNWIKHNVIDPLSNAFSNVRDGIENAMSGVRDAITAPFEAAWHWIRDNVIEPIGNGFSSAIQTIKDVWNGFAGVWNGIDISFPGISIPFAPDVPGFTIGLPDLPTFAAGAYVTGPTVAMVGEAGREFVAPEPMLRRLIREELGGGGISITVNGALDPDAVARQIESLLTRRNRRVNGVTRSGAAT